MAHDISSDSPLRWGIAATGGIARAFARDLALLPDASLEAVGSRSQESAEKFGQAYDVRRRHGSYADLAADPEIDAIYVATPHPAHAEVALLALSAGKAVLVEKPFTLNAVEAAQIVETARQRGLFAMEAMWTRFLPHVAAVRELLQSGAIGDVVSVVADHGQAFPEDAAHRLFAPELGGGALLDLGIYPISFCSMVLGPPSAVTAISAKAFTGVDAQTSVLLEHPNGAHGIVTTTLRSSTATTAVINGTSGRIEIEGRFYAPSAFTVVDADGRRQRRSVPFEGHGLRMQAAEVARCLRSGLTESPLMPLDETLSIMATMDEVRRQIGLVYPDERTLEATV